MNLPIFNLEGKNVGSIDLDDSVFTVKRNDDVLHSLELWYLAGKRAGTSSSKTRTEVRGGGKKPWKQKGTGRARSGSIRSPLWRGGGVIFGPKPRSFKYNLPKKVRLLALKMAISEKIKQNKMKIVENFILPQPKTKEFAKSLKNLGVLGQKNVIFSEGKDDNLVRCGSNVKNVAIYDRKSANAYYLMNCDNLILSKEAVLGFSGSLK